MYMYECPVCGKETAFESEFVYSGNPYDREYCVDKDCGWWANAVMDSREIEEEI